MNAFLRNLLLACTLCWAALALLVLVGCRREPAPHAPGNRDGLIPVRFQTDWYPQAEHGGFYQALARGFYAEAGLDVTILPGGPGARTPQRVIGGAADVSMYRSDDLMVQSAEGLPFVFVAAFMQHDPQALLLHADNPIETFPQLDGQTIMAMPGTNWINYLQRRYQIRFDLLPMSYGLAHFAANPRLIQQCFITSEPFHAQNQGLATKTMLLADSGYDPYRVIFTTQRFLREQPEAVRAFVAASLRGWYDFLYGDPTPGKAAIQAANSEMTDALMNYSIETMRHYQLVAGDPAAGERIGQLDRSRLEAQRQILVDLGLLPPSVTLDQVVRFDFLPDTLPRAPAPSP